MSKTLDSFFTSSISSSKEETELFTQYLPQELKIAVIQHSHSHTTIIKGWLSVKGNVHKDSFIVWELMQMLNNETQSDYQKIRPVWPSRKLCYSIKTSQLSYIISWLLYIVQKIQLLLLLFVCFKLWKPFTAEVIWII